MAFRDLLYAVVFVQKSERVIQSGMRFWLAGENEELVLSLGNQLA